MKKSLIALSIAAMALSVGLPALAKEKHDRDHHDHNEGMHLGEFEHDQSKFVLTGVVVSKTATNMVITVKSSVNAGTLTNNQATVDVTSETKITPHKDDQTLTFADIQIGNQVVVQGIVNSDLSLMAKKIHVRAARDKTFGEVTAKTDTSITIKNNITDVSQTFSTDGTTKVNINGESKTTADIQVGDRGFVKFKNQVSGFLAKLINLFR